MRVPITWGCALLLGASIAFAQRNPPPPPPPPRGHPILPAPPGKWWENPSLGLTADQQKKMEDLFQQNRVKLIDLNATLQKEEVVLEPLVNADQADDAKILAQIDRIAQARAELEKANARMLLAMRHVLTSDQWKKVQAEVPVPPGRARR